MLFNSFEFILLFLPLAFGLFWYGGHGLRWRLGFLTFASYAFYSYWQFEHQPLEYFFRSFAVWEKGGIGRFLWAWRFTLIMFLSSSVDYYAGNFLAKIPTTARRDRIKRALLLALSLTANLGLLGFFKYAGFLTSILNDLSHFMGGGGVPVISVVFAAGISFYTFESMSYVIDVYRGIAKPTRSYLDYACFISFFPHLIAGPIIRWSDILHQFRDIHWTRRRPDWEQVNLGLVLLTMGLAKKLIIADRITAMVEPLWRAVGEGHALTGAGSWAAVLGYTFRIYFDFSGYSDMATGIGHMFAVRLPQNFDSPYKATDPSDFWRRWHITLSTWLRDYLYFPLGGSRGSKLFTARNLMITMFLGGLWHGAAWLFIIWGLWHGLLLAVFHILKAKKWWLSNEDPVAYWFNRNLTFLLVVIGWVFFRCADAKKAELGLSSIKPALVMLKQMFTLSPEGQVVAIPRALIIMLPLCWAWCNFMPNSFEVAYKLRLRYWIAMAGGATLAACMLHFGVKVDFLYFRF